MARIKIHLWSGLRRLTDGDLEAVEVEASTVGEALVAVAAQHPGLGPILASGVSVVIDGEVSTSRRQAIPPDSEVYLMQRLKGG